jgi:ADP-ribosylglycohydrolase
MTGIIGAIVGDLIGQAYEFHSTKDYNFELLSEKSHVTDDSTCIIAVADWLLHTNRTHGELVDKFKYWCNKCIKNYINLFQLL